MANLFMTVQGCVGVHPESVGGSTGRLEHLSDV
jgi:hypothetical protein